MSVAIITGSSGLIGSETAKCFHGKGLDVVGIDNNMRRYFFGEDGSVDWMTRGLKKALKNFAHHSTDIRNQAGIESIFKKYKKSVSLVVHAAAQPSHDWAAREPLTDFTINANGTLILLEAARKFCPEAAFIFTSTNKVYGDRPNSLPFIEKESRWEIDPSHPCYKYGIDESMSIDGSKHSLFGASKVAADVLVQEYGRYFGMKTGIFRSGCLTGPAHCAAELHGFLAYLVKCAVGNRTYTIYGYKGKQVRDNIHSFDLANAFWHFYRNPGSAAVYNLGGSRHSNCSILEAIRLIEELSGEKIKYKMTDRSRPGDHIWWISDIRRFQKDYPGWKYKYDLPLILQETVESMRART